MSTEPARHWRDYLVTGVPADGRRHTVEIPVHADEDGAAVLMILSRLRGVLDAIRRQPGLGEPEPLEAEDPDDLYHLLINLHKVRMVLEGQEERVLLAAHRRGVSLRTLAAALDVSSPETVRYRLEKIRTAEPHGRTAAALDEDPLSAGSPITHEGNTVSDTCTHQNLGSVQINIVNGKTTVSADCLDCGAQIRR